MSGTSINEAGRNENVSPEIQAGLVEELTAAYAAFLKHQRTTSAAYVRWTPSHSRAHEFAWLDAGQELLLMGGGKVTVTPSSPIYSSVQKMMATIELNPYERELRYGYPYVIGQLDGKTIRAPLLSIAIAITTDRDHLIISTCEDVVRFNSLPFRTEADAGVQELALARLIEQTPTLPLTVETLTGFCNNVTRELRLRVPAALNGLIKNAPLQPRSAMELAIVDCAACFIAPKSSYFLVSDLEKIGRNESSKVNDTALGWLLGKRPAEPTSDRFEDRGKLYYPFPSNPSQRRVAHLLDDPKTRIAVIEGPPGTGKSLTIANLVCHLVATGKRVLITSQKDKALDVVDDLLTGLGLGQLPMTLLRQDRESKQQLRERLESIQKERSSEQTQQEMDRQAKSHAEAAEHHERVAATLGHTLMAEHSVELAETALRNTRGRFARLMGKWKLRKALRTAERNAGGRSDTLGDTLRKIRERLRAEATLLLEKAAEHRTSVATKAERNLLREFAKLLGRNQANYKNYPVFDRLKAEPERCNMLLKILPCWIMTPDDVARLFPCEAGLFDVVIIDEASQCDLPSMTPVLFRAKQAVIAGDSKQMQSQRFAFTASQISNQAWVERGLDRFDPNGWLNPSKIDLLQLASIRKDEEVFLEEHYRSLPPIIGFSNERWYGNKLRIMRDPDDRRFGDPDCATVTLHRVHGKVASETQENEREARSLIEHLRGMLEHPAYSGASFGVICLFQEQMRFVNDMVAEQISDQLRTAHDLVVVNPDGFQGDERDIILYSLSYDGEGMSQSALSARQADREHIQGMLNVAFTRARDEIHVFYSADLKDFATASGSGAIKEWLEYCLRHSGQSAPPVCLIEAQLAKAQSEFETQVLSALNAQGVIVKAQYPCCGYSIDCVAELDGSRVAIECDGEIWHLDEHGHLKTEDLVRQEVLERAGWNVVRIPYRSWREDPEKQLNRILDELRNDLSSEDVPPSQPATTAQTLHIDKFEDAVIKALKSGKRSNEEAFRFARELLGYSRLGQQVRASLSDAVGRLERRQIIRVEEEESFFKDDKARDALYEVKNTAPSPYGRPRRRTYRRHSRYRKY